MQIIKCIEAAERSWEEKQYGKDIKIHLSEIPECSIDNLSEKSFPFENLLNSLYEDPNFQSLLLGNLNDKERSIIVYSIAQQRHLYPTIAVINIGEKENRAAYYLELDPE